MSEREGVVYRCHLSGVQVKPGHVERINNHLSPFDDIYRRIFRNKVNRCGGWLLCRISNIDMYKRILVELWDPISNECFNESVLSCTIYTKYIAQTSVVDLQ